jgi:hypothetical protein
MVEDLQQIHAGGKRWKNFAIAAFRIVSCHTIGLAIPCACRILQTPLSVI